MTTNLSAIQTAIQTNWKVDPLHSELFFKIKYLTISVVTGFIQEFDLNVQTTGNDFGEVTDLRLTADMTTLRTNHEPRDEHLKSPDFFDATSHPQVVFEAHDNKWQ